MSQQATNRRPNPFEIPRPGLAYRAFGADADAPLSTRSPTQAHEAFERHVTRWFGQCLGEVPADATRPERIDVAFVAHGWVIQAIVADVSQRWPMHGWLLTHPSHGRLIYFDPGRDGDLGPGWVARSSGPWGTRACMVWSQDVAALLTRATSHSSAVFPQWRVVRVLAAHAYRTLDPVEQQSVAVLVALAGRDLPTLLAVADADDLSVLHV